MKKLFFLAFLSLSAHAALAQQITNGGFESWSEVFAFEAPDDWRTANGRFIDLVNTTKVVPAPSGASAVRLETMTSDNEIVFGYVLQGDFDDNGIPDRGVPFTTEIAAVEGSVRYGSMPNDTAYMLFAAFQGGVLVAQDAFTFSGSQSAWTSFTRPLSFGPVTPDSILFGVASSNPFDDTYNAVGSWIEVDNIRFTSPNVTTPDLIPNHDFEDWTDVTVEDPDGWGTFNLLTAGFDLTTVTKSTDAYSGNFSARISTLLEPQENFELAGVLTNGELDENGPSGGVPYAASPTMFTGQYKLFPVADDSVTIAVSFTANGTLVGGTLIRLGGTHSTWTPIMETLFLFGVPDSMTVSVLGGDSVGTELLLDELDLSGGNVGLEEASVSRQAPFPNPAADRVTVPELRTNDRIRLIDMTGRMVLERFAHAGGSIALDIHDLPDGAYTIEVNGPEKAVRYALVKAGRHH